MKNAALMYNFDSFERFVAPKFNFFCNKFLSLLLQINKLCIILQQAKNI